MDKDNEEPAPKKRKATELESDASNDKEAVSGCYSFEKHECPEDLEITPIPTSKDDIEQPPLAEHEDMFIPPLGSSVVISGKSGSGKSTLLANFFRDERFYGPSKAKPDGWFDKVFLFSPTANGDDVQKSLGIDPKHVFTDLEEAPELLEIILNTQQDKLNDAEGADKVEQFAIIFDDIIGDVSFMNEKAFTRCFYQVRHVNCTTFICTQHFKRVPRVCRLQANFIFFFQGSASEVEIVVEEFAPPEYTKNEMRSMINEATNKRYTFLTINMKLGWDKRFRRNLDEFISLPRLECEEEEQTDDKCKNYDDDTESDTDRSDSDSDFEGALEQDETERTFKKGKLAEDGGYEQTATRRY